MLRGSKPEGPSGGDASRQQLGALQSDMLGADDAKFRRIVGLLERSPDDRLLQAVLDPMRPRLASLRPVRPLRFSRLLFIPLADLLVPAGDWEPGRAAVPRSVLKSISNTVRVAFGSESAELDTLIAGHDTSEPEIVAQAGERLWARAGAILAQAPPPVDWEDTALPLAAYAPLARGIATVLCRATVLQALRRDVEVGMLRPSDATISKIVFGMVGEPALGRALVFKQILWQFPNSIALLRRLMDFSQAPVDRALLKTAIDSGTADVLADLERGVGMANGLRDGALSAVGVQVQQIISLLRDLGEDAGASHGLRLRSIGAQMDAICRDRFVDGINKGLAAPLDAASGPVDGDGQKRLESCARDLHIVDAAGRKLGGAAPYDALIAQASEVIATAVASGTLSRVRGIRLVEILAGPEAAAQLYYATRKR